MDASELVAVVMLTIAFAAYVTHFLGSVIKARRDAASAPDDAARALIGLDWFRRVRMTNGAIVLCIAAAGIIAFLGTPGFVPNGLAGIAVMVAIGALAAFVPVPRGLALRYAWLVFAGNHPREW